MQLTIEGLVIGFSVFVVGILLWVIKEYKARNDRDHVTFYEEINNTKLTLTRIETLLGACSIKILNGDYKKLKEKMDGKSNR